MIPKHDRPLVLLLVEDSPGDVRLIQEAFRSTDTVVDLHVVTDGAEAMPFLRREGEQAGAPRPDLILLGLNLPEMAGREVLAEIKEDPGLRAIPTVILTSVEGRADVVKSYELQANAYLIKPVDLDAFESLVKSINDFWVHLVQFPHVPR